MTKIVLYWKFKLIWRFMYSQQQPLQNGWDGSPWGRQWEPWESPACLWPEQEHMAAAMTEAGRKIREAWRIQHLSILKLFRCIKVTFSMQDGSCDFVMFKMNQQIKRKIFTASKDTHLCKKGFYFPDYQQEVPIPRLPTFPVWEKLNLIWLK